MAGFPECHVTVVVVGISNVAGGSGDPECRMALVVVGISNVAGGSGDPECHVAVVVMAAVDVFANMVANNHVARNVVDHLKDDALVVTAADVVAVSMIGARGHFFVATV